jgi:hypothetical protein
MVMTYALPLSIFVGTVSTTRAALVKNAGHFAAFTQPEQFLSELLTWGRRVGRRPRSSE